VTFLVTLPWNAFLTSIATLSWIVLLVLLVGIEWYLHQPESHQLSLQKGVGVRDLERPDQGYLGPIKITSTHSSQGEIVKSDRMEVMVGGSDAMAALVEGTKELAATDGQGDAGEFQFQSFSLCAKSNPKDEHDFVQHQLSKRRISFLPPTASLVSSAEILLPIDYTISPSLKLLVYVNEVAASVWLDSFAFFLMGCLFMCLGRRTTRL